MTASGKELWFPWHSGVPLLDQTHIDEVSTMAEVGPIEDYRGGQMMVQRYQYWHDGVVEGAQRTCAVSNYQAGNGVRCPPCPTVASILHKYELPLELPNKVLSHRSNFVKRPSREGKYSMASVRY